MGGLQAPGGEAIKTLADLKKKSWFRGPFHSDKAGVSAGIGITGRAPKGKQQENNLPVGAPAGVWLRVVSATEIEVGP